MGNFYVNYTVRSKAQGKVASALKGRRSIVSPCTQGVVVVFDKASDKQDEKIIAPLAKMLSLELAASVLAVMNHDDDLLWYQLWTLGQMIDQYNSCPDYFDFDGNGEMAGPVGGDAEKLCNAFGSANVDEVEKILRNAELDETGYLFAFQRHLALNRSLGLPDFPAGASYRDFDQGRPDELPEGEFVRTT